MSHRLIFEFLVATALLAAIVVGFLGSAGCSPRDGETDASAVSSPESSASRLLNYPEIVNAAHATKSLRVATNNVNSFVGKVDHNASIVLMALRFPRNEDPARAFVQIKASAFLLRSGAERLVANETQLVEVLEQYSTVVGEAPEVFKKGQAACARIAVDEPPAAQDVYLAMGEIFRESAKWCVSVGDQLSQNRCVERAKARAAKMQHIAGLLRRVEQHLCSEPAESFTSATANAYVTRLMALRDTFDAYRTELHSLVEILQPQPRSNDAPEN